ncbi:uncharacterized protein [Aegilops tauschii subsp. strangulata]|uniref:uncharacterized protein n=1 Tax=Aegilops tauschii subsp. strangulata TaxID=200361 RepID=UPI001ABC6DA2|nr:uncharacterized protein LOC120961854 [Aegilops tauschii subsp. strangulata]
MGESTCLKTTVKFTRAMVEVFGPEYLREPNVQGTKKLLAIGQARGFQECSDQLIACIGNGRTAPKVLTTTSMCFNDLRRSGGCNGESPPCNYTVNGRDYNMGYYLADGIYPQWAAFVKTISEPRGKKQSHFATMQEAARKDVERALGVLQARWEIMRSAAMMWESETL